MSTRMLSLLAIIAFLILITGEPADGQVRLPIKERQDHSTAGTDSRRYPVASEGYLVIAAPALAQGSGLGDLLSLRSSQGFDVTLVDTNTTGPGAQDIKAFIQNAFYFWTVPPQYLLLVGDTNAIPAWTGQGQGNPPTDLEYAEMNGDYLPDVLCGRLSVRTITELDNLCAKIIAVDGTSLRKAAFLAGESGWQDTEAVHNAVIDYFLAPAGWECDKLYTHTYGATTADVAAAFNDGRAVGCFRGHSNTSAWFDGPPFYQYDVRVLTNTAYPLILSFGCQTGDFTADECFGETWVRGSHGAAAFWGASSYVYWSTDSNLEIWFFEGLVSSGSHTIGEAAAYAQVMVYMSSGGSPTEKRAVIEMYNLLGDPAMKVIP